MRETRFDPYLKHKNSLRFNLNVPFSQSNQDKIRRLVGLKLEGQDQTRSKPSKL